MPTETITEKEEKIISKLGVSFNINTNNIYYIKRSKLNLSDFKNKIIVVKSGISIDRFLFVNIHGDIMEQGWDITLSNPGSANIDYRMRPEYDFVINKKEPIKEDIKMSEEERNEKLKKIYDKFFSTAFLAIVWIQQRDSLIENTLFVFRPGERITTYNNILLGPNNEWSY